MPNDTDLLDERAEATADAARALREPVLAPLPELGVLAFSGPDATAFLQSQLTNDVAHLTGDAMQLNGYCTAKGRLLATFHQWRRGDEVLLRLPLDILPAVMKRLSMFVLRAKVKVADASASWATYGLFGGNLSALAQRAGVALPAAPWTGALIGEARIDRVPGTDRLPERFLLTSPATAPLPAWCADLPRAAAAAWWWSEIEAAVPTVFAATQEKFVPQMINFEVLGGVNFKKGCYPGQEVVARSQYLGKLRRRMQRGHVDATEVATGGDVFHSGGTQPVGTIVLAAPAPGGGTDLLFEVPIDRLDSGTLHVNAPGGPVLAVRPLPYELFDPTA
ncbi:MAG: folate-binding protein [Betaproteobacteria bacterium]|jgi:folate-binding protein YgfZ|nr:folate-binding protein [Betaproteobacteria bacterium]